MKITKAEGEEIAYKFMDEWTKGFVSNTLKDILADEITLSWSDGTKGKKSAEDFLSELKQGWGAIIDKQVLGNTVIVIDTDEAKIVLAFEGAQLCITGKVLSVPGVHILQLDDKKKVKSWSGIWDNNDKKMADVVAEAAAKLGIELNDKQSNTHKLMTSAAVNVSSTADVDIEQ